jgi:hypothetical protein
MFPNGKASLNAKERMFSNIVSSSIKFALFVDIYEMLSHVLFHYCSLFFPTKCNDLVAYCGL